jgi:hypothetical protein
VWLPLLLIGAGQGALGCRGPAALSTSDASPEPRCAQCPPCISNQPGPPNPVNRRTREEDAGRDLGAPMLPDAKPPFTGKTKQEPLSATSEQWLEFLTLAAKYRGRDVTRAALQDALKTGGAGSTAWSKFCSDVGFATDETLRPLCTTEFEWSLTLDVADMDGDGRPEYWLFGTWVIFDHHDGLLGIFARNDSGLRPLPRPELVPENGPGLSFGRPILVKTAQGVRFTSTHSGEEIRDPDYVAHGGQGFYRITRQFETHGGAFLLTKESKTLTEPEH